MVKKKTDKIDAEKLAIFLKMQITSNEELVKPVYIPEKTIQNAIAILKSRENFQPGDRVVVLSDIIAGAGIDAIQIRAIE